MTPRAGVIINLAKEVGIKCDPYLSAWAKLSWDGGLEELRDFWWLSPEEALDRTYQALEEAIEVFPEQAMYVLALLIQYDFDPARAWAVLEGSR